MDPSQQKQHLRNRIKERLAHLNEKDRQAESRSICRRILAELPAEPGVLCAYATMPSEADVSHLFPPLLEQGWKIFLPRFAGAGFEFRQLLAPDALAPGMYRIPEPPASAPLLDPSEATVVLLPGMAFDRRGNRLGRGNGGYDKWLGKVRRNNPSLHVIGVALDCQMVNAIPEEPHDQKVDAVATPRELILVTAQDA